VDISYAIDRVRLGFREVGLSVREKESRKRMNGSCGKKKGGGGTGGASGFRTNLGKAGLTRRRGGITYGKGSLVQYGRDRGVIQGPRVLLFVRNDHEKFQNLLWKRAESFMILSREREAVERIHVKIIPLTVSGYWKFRLSGCLALLNKRVEKRGFLDSRVRPSGGGRTCMRIRQQVVSESAA